MQPLADPWFYAVAIPAVLLAGVSKAGLGGFVMLAVPLMSLAIAPPQAAAILLPILCLLDLLGLWAYRGKSDRELLRWLLPGALIGIAVGALLFKVLDARWVKAIVGIECLAFALHRLRQDLGSGPPPAAAERRAAPAAFWGGVSGFTSTIAHAGGPPLMQYLMPLRMAKERFVATTVIFFTTVNLTKLAPYAMLGLFDWNNLGTSIALVPAVPIGYAIGLALVRRIPERPFYLLLTASLLIVGVKLCWDAVAG
jgi:uncharacterized membrane protein YfcA